MHGAFHCPSVGLWGIYCCLLSWPCSKEKWKKLCRSSKMNFQGREIFKRFFNWPIKPNESCSWQLTFLSKWKLFRMIKWGRMNVCTFWFETQSIQHFFLFFYFTHHLRHPHQTWRMSNFRLNRLGDQLKSIGHLSKQNNGLHSHSSGS